MPLILRTPRHNRTRGRRDHLLVRGKRPETSPSQTCCPRSYTSECQRQDLSPGPSASRECVPSLLGQAASKMTLRDPTSWYSHPPIIFPTWGGPGDSLLRNRRGKGDGCHFQVRLQRDSSFCPVHTLCRAHPLSRTPEASGKSELPFGSRSTALWQGTGAAARPAAIKVLSATPHEELNLARSLVSKLGRRPSPVGSLG